MVVFLILLLGFLAYLYKIGFAPKKETFSSSSGAPPGLLGAATAPTVKEISGSPGVLKKVTAPNEGRPVSQEVLNNLTSPNK